MARARNRSRREPLAVICAAVALAFFAGPAFGAASLAQHIEPAEVNVGDPVIVTLTVRGGTLNGTTLPTVDGLQVTGNRIQIQSSEDEGLSVASFISLIPTRPGNFVIPGFTLRTQEGDILHVQPMKLHVLSNGNGSSASVSSPALATNAPTAAAPRGPVVMPPATATSANNSATSATAGDQDSSPTLPRDPDGTPAKVFLTITVQSADAYAGQSIPVRIDFYIRMDVNWQQNSIPTIKGSDFLMATILGSSRQSMVLIENEQYSNQTWITSISSPKSGEFPLAVEQDTYWVKSMSYFNQHPDLAHEMIPSNQVTMHVHELPTEGRPPGFTGAIGQFNVSGAASPTAVTVGEPVQLRFLVTGVGNFDYVRCPSLAPDPAWKAYVPVSHTDFLDEARIQASKGFEQSIIPQKNGSLPLPRPTFSYFDPTAKEYVSVPIDLPVITVSGAPATAPAAASGSGDASATTTAAIVRDPFSPNRADLGLLRPSLTPTYRRAWFWIAQAGLLLALLLGAAAVFLRRYFGRSEATALRAERKKSLQGEERAMADAVARGDALLFFTAARHVVQLRLGGQWNLRPEAITLREIAQRDPTLAASLAPLFRTADEVIYSGHALPDLDLAQWQEQVRRDLPELVA